MNEAEFETLDLKEAAAFLKIHPVTLSTKAASGEIHGAKIGRAWVFLKVDLIAHIRTQYKSRALLSDERKEILCHSTNAKIPEFGGLKSPSLEKRYKEVLGLSTKSRPKNSTIG